MTEEQRAKAKARSKAYYWRHKAKLIKRSSDWRNNDPRRHLLHGARERAKRHNVPCEIGIDDICIPEYCPILDLKLERGKGIQQECSPSLDRIEPEKEYVKGNICVISYAANRLKSNMSKSVLQRLYDYVFRL